MNLRIIIQFNSIRLIYLRAWQKLEKANYSQALKQQYRIKYNILKSAHDLKSQELILRNKRNITQMYNMKLTEYNNQSSHFPLHSVLKGESVFAKYIQKSTYVICSTSTPSWRSLSQSTADAKSRTISYLSCRRTKTCSIHDWITIYFALKNIN
jgi:hypothetical protein